MYPLLSESRRAGYLATLVLEEPAASPRAFRLWVVDDVTPLFTLPGPGGIAVHAFRCHLEDYHHTYGTSEIESVFTMPLAWFQTHEPSVLEVQMEMRPEDQAAIRELIHRSDYAFRPQIKVMRFYNTDHGVIWGLTAEILYRITHS